MSTSKGKFEPHQTDKEKGQHADAANAAVKAAQDKSAARKEEETTRRATIGPDSDAVNDRSREEEMRHTARTDEHEVEIRDGKLSPDNMRYRAGKTVSWWNNSKVPATVEFDAAEPGQVGCVAPPSSPAIPADGVYRYAFSVPGAYKYHLKDSPDAKGVVTVS